MFINKKLYHLQIKVLFILALSFCLSACISRLSRPEMTGYVTDEQDRRLAQVQVGETQTDEHGYFQLKEQRYYAFLLTEILAMEAPALGVQEQVEKAGYQRCYLQMFSSFGGGQSKGAKWNVGQVILMTNKQAKISGELLDCMIKNQEK